MNGRLNIPNLKMNSDKYIFKKKSSLRRKSSTRLLTESAFMFIFSLLLVYINYLIPNKNQLLKNLPINLNDSFNLISELFLNLYEILLVIFIFSSLIITLFLLIGSLYRLFRITKRNAKQISYMKFF